LESAVRTVCEPIYNKPLKEISFGQVLLRLFEAAQRFNITIQPQLILLQKTLLQIEGLGRQLYPELDLWQTAHPILREWMRERADPRTAIRELRKQLPDLGEALRLVPKLITQSINLAAEGRLHVPTDSLALEQLRDEMRTHARRRDLTIVTASLLISSVVWFAFVNQPWWPGGLLALLATIAFWHSRRTI
jgi:ubiquinone biosynthesis protein